MCDYSKRIQEFCGRNNFTFSLEGCGGIGKRCCARVEAPGSYYIFYINHPVVVKGDCVNFNVFSYAVRRRRDSFLTARETSEYFKRVLNACEYYLNLRRDKEDKGAHL